MGDTTKVTRMTITMTNIMTKVPVVINNTVVDMAEGDVVATIQRKILRPSVILR